MVDTEVAADDATDDGQGAGGGDAGHAARRWYQAAADQDDADAQAALQNLTLNPE